MEKDVELSLAHKADGVVIQTKAYLVTNIFLEPSLPRLQTEMVIFQDTVAGDPSFMELFGEQWLSKAGSFSPTLCDFWESEMA